MLDEEKRRYLYRSIYDDSMWLINLVENLLSLTRMGNGSVSLNIRPELLDEVFHEALSHLDRNAEQHHISVELEDDLLMADMDARLIVQVVINLVNNAIKYTPAGSHISLSAVRAGPFVQVEVSDDGPGIADSAKQKIFDMFYTADNSRGDGRRGLGLGLSLCRSIITAHGGEISRSGSSAPRVSISFHPEGLGGKNCMNKPHILMVEDDAAVGNLIATTLETQNYQFHRAKTGASALVDALSYRPDVMLLDLGLPDMDGVDIIKKVRTWSNLPIIVISARSEDSDKVAALDAGADDYLTKPFSVDELLARLRVALRRVRYDSQKVSEEASLYENGNLKIDYAAGCAYRDGVEIHLTPIEYKLLCLLARNTGKVLTHNFILNEIWGSSAFSDTPSLRVFMATLRKKLEVDPSHPQYIQTHIGVGYRMIRQKQEDEA